MAKEALWIELGRPILWVYWGVTFQSGKWFGHITQLLQHSIKIFLTCHGKTHNNWSTAKLSFVTKYSALIWSFSVIIEGRKIKKTYTKSRKDVSKLATYNRATNYSKLTWLAMASCKSVTISSPSTPEHLKPLVHVTSRDLLSPSWLHGNENVNPMGSGSFSKPCSSKNSLIPFAMWLNS